MRQVRARSFFFSSRRRHTRWNCDWSSDVCSSDLPFLRARVEEVPELMPAPGDLEAEALARNAMALFRRIAELSPLVPDEITEAIEQLTHPGRIPDAIAASLPSLSSQ